MRELPTWLADEISSPAPNVDPTTGEITSQTAERPSRAIMSDERPGDAWAAQTSWESLMARMGAIVHPPDGTGKRMVTRPGKDPRDGPSATIGWDGNDALHVFSSNWPPFVAGRSVDKLGALKAIHGGDLDSALAECRRVTGMDKREPMMSSHAAHTAFPVNTTADAMSDAIVPQGQVLTEADEDAFWGATAELALVREWGEATRLSPWVLLGCLMIRILSHVPPKVRLPGLAGVGHGASLNLFLAAVGGPAAGKSSAWSITSDIAALPRGELGELRPIPLGSGQGIAHAFQPDNDPSSDDEAEIITSVIFHADEIANLAASAAMKNSNLWPQLCSMWMGEALGGHMVDRDRRRHIPAHIYRAGLFVGVQPAAAQTLLDHAETGLPQRFLWMPAEWSRHPDVAGPIPRKIEWGFPHVIGNPCFVEICTQAREDVDSDRLAHARGLGVTEQHSLLQQLKVAAFLGMLTRREFSVTNQDWELASAIMRVSAHTRQTCERYTRAAIAERNRSLGKADATRAVIVEDAREQRLHVSAARRIIHVVGRDRPTSHRDLQRALTAPQREVWAEVLDHLVATKQIIVEGDGPARRYALAAS